MALLSKRKFLDSLLLIEEEREEVHVFEPEFHQDIYVDACEDAKKTKGAFQLGNEGVVERYPNRGSQPAYADDDNDPDSVIYQGMLLKDGTDVKIKESDNVCALKSVAIRWGFVDYGVARCVTRSFYERKKAKNSVIYGDVLINSTGDGRIGRVAVYNRKHPAIVDGHVTIVRFRDKQLGWYAAAYLLSVEGQRQIYRYINGSSGQVEIYPQDIARIWIPSASKTKIENVAKKFQNAVRKYEEFQAELSATLASI